MSQSIYKIAYGKYIYVMTYLYCIHLVKGIIQMNIQLIYLNFNISFTFLNIILMEISFSKYFLYNESRFLTHKPDQNFQKIWQYIFGLSLMN